ncbi:hypothetical protein [Roseateles terrae]|uniref:Uncharacterized protein n=1 Tax=Roseateles terrae TaxID=431060 RepID=A0ABR6GLJ8_9BURK|nr:hypothetical protein [Roseateles terrae]MBB3192983.1 hypothetical protein [Roseateles terrae]
MARSLAALPFDFEVLHPPELNQELARLAASLARRAGTTVARGQHAQGSEGRERND